MCPIIQILYDGTLVSIIDRSFGEQETVDVVRVNINEQLILATFLLSKFIVLGIRV